MSATWYPEQNSALRKAVFGAEASPLKGSLLPLNASSNKLHPLHNTILYGKSFKCYERLETTQISGRKKREAFTSNLVHIQSKSIQEQGNQSDTEEKASRKRKEVKHTKDV